MHGEEIRSNTLFYATKLLKMSDMIVKIGWSMPYLKRLRLGTKMLMNPGLARSEELQAKFKALYLLEVSR